MKKTCEYLSAIRATFYSCRQFCELNLLHVLLLDLTLEPAEAPRELLVEVLLHVVGDPHVGRLTLYRVLPNEEYIASCDVYKTYGFFQCCGSGSARIRIHFGQLDPDPDPGGPKLPTKVKKIQVLKCQMFSFEG